MRLEPVNFGRTHIAIRQTHGCNSFQLLPATRAITLSQYRQDANSTACRNCFNLRDVVEDFELHLELYILNQDLESFEFAQIGDAAGQIGNLSYKGEAVLLHLLILSHDEDFIEEGIDGGDEGDDDVQEFIQIITVER